jgi:tRNA (guanine37-N1)-methyltransferase
MRLDLVTIFPEYFAPLQLSLVGKAVAAGLVDLRIHDLRQWTQDVHRSVDDTPYGGGAGMVMKPEPWGQCFDELLGPDGPMPDSLAEAVAQKPSEPATAVDVGPALAGSEALLFNSSPVSGDDPVTTAMSADPVTTTPGVEAQVNGRTIVVVPSPSGLPFSQHLAHEWAGAQRLFFACGRYEGIDARVTQYAAQFAEVVEVSLGDYVVNGGEVAALAIIEAVVRLLPGVIGNPESLLEESHSPQWDGLLEYPLYTKPASWRGFDVPAVLLSGDHAKIAQWRRQQAEALTRQRRPDLAG